MCLQNFGRKKVAKEDIIVYKHLILTEEEGYITSFMRAPVEFEVLYKSRIRKETLNPEFNPPGTVVIQKALHSYVNKVHAEHAARMWTTCDNKEVPVQCTIPKGSIYYIGQFDNKEAIASNQLIYNFLI